MYMNLTKLPIGKQLQIKRVIVEMTQTELAKELGIHRTTLSTIEKGTSELPEKLYEAVEKFLNS